jgi:hypothetical protein
MGILSGMFSKVKMIEHTADSVGRVWRHILDESPELESFEVAKRAYLFRPAKYHSDYQEVFHQFAEMDRKLGYTTPCRFSPRSLVEYVLMFEVGMDNSMITDTVKYQDTILRGLKKNNL